MIADPRSGFGQVVRFLGGTIEPDRFDRAVRFSAFGVLREQETTAGFHERPRDDVAFFNEGRSGRWRDLLTGEQARDVERRHAAEMQRFGYL